jgi:hypothetical protein
MLERVMIGEEREKKKDDFDFFPLFIIEHLVKDTSNIDEEKIDIDVRKLLFKLTLDSVD